MSWKPNLGKGVANLGRQLLERNRAFTTGRIIRLGAVVVGVHQATRIRHLADGEFASRAVHL